MKLADFNTLAEAQAYELVTDKKQIGSVTHKPITQAGGYAVIHTNAVCENHNPRLIAKAVNPRTNKTTYQRINNFYNVGEVSSYDCKLTSEYLSHELFVDDVYSVII